MEDLGFKGDVLEVDVKFARTDLLLTGKAVYASDFNLNWYKDLIEVSLHGLFYFTMRNYLVQFFPIIRL